MVFGDKVITTEQPIGWDYGIYDRAMADFIRDYMKITPEGDSIPIVFATPDRARCFTKDTKISLLDGS